MGYEYEITRSKVVSSLIWKVLERLGTQGTQLLVIILLARLLLPEDFGIIVLVTIFITIGGFIVDSGFSEALIQKKDADEIDFSSVFYLNIFTSSILYALFFFSAPYIASFYNESDLTLILRILSITLFFNAINSVQQAVIARHMHYKKLFASSFSAITLSGLLGIIMAMMNFGIWALVAQQLTHRLLVTSILWYTVKWRPIWCFSFTKIRSLFSYGWKLLLSTLLYTFYLQIHNLLIGKIFLTSVLGFYNRGMQFPNIIVDNINGSIQNVLFPAFSAQQENITKVREMLNRLINLCSFIVFPMMVGLATISEPLINVLLTDKWMPTVPFLQLFCVYYALWAIDASNLQVIKALGRSDLYLKLEIIKFIIGLLLLLISIPFGVYALAIGMLITGLIGSFLNGYTVSKLLNNQLWDQWKNLFPIILISICMGCIVYSIKFIGMTDIVTLIIQVVVGVMLYIGLATFFKLKSLIDIISILKSQKAGNYPLKRAIK